MNFDTLKTFERCVQLEKKKEKGGTKLGKLNRLISIVGLTNSNQRKSYQNYFHINCNPDWDRFVIDSKVIEVTSEKAKSQ